MSDPLKKCFKCGDSKPRSEFYKHGRMNDGFLGKCKACTRADTKARTDLLSTTDPDWLEREAARHRAKSERYRKTGRAKPITPAYAKMRTRKFRSEHPLKTRAHGLVNKALAAGKLTRQPCEKCGNPEAQAHHEDYSKPLDVNWLCVTHHAARHVEINSERRLSRFATRSE